MFIGGFQAGFDLVIAFDVFISKVIIAGMDFADDGDEGGFIVGIGEGVVSVFRVFGRKVGRVEQLHGRGRFVIPPEDLVHRDPEVVGQLYKHIRGRLPFPILIIAYGVFSNT